MWSSRKLNTVSMLLALVISALWWGTAHTNQFIEMKGARFPAQQPADLADFSLQGAGILKWGIWFDVYAAAYYVDETNPQNQRLVIHYFVPIKAKQIQAAAEKHMLKQNGTEFYRSIKSSLDRLHGAMLDVVEGDSYALNFYQGRDLVLEYNGNVVFRVTDPQLGRAYLDLWLGNNPLDENLKLSLMGIKTNS